MREPRADQSVKPGSRNGTQQGNSHCQVTRTDLREQRSRASAGNGPAYTEQGPAVNLAFVENLVGKGREDAGTQPLMESANMRIRTYNMQDEQFAFHRALRSEEVRIQFRGDALDLSEFENVEVVPGEVTIIPLGISHSVISIPPLLLVPQHDT